MESDLVIPLFYSAYDPNSFSNRIMDLIASYVVGRNGITRDEAEAWTADLRQSGARGEYFFSLNRYLFLATRA